MTPLEQEVLDLCPFIKTCKPEDEMTLEDYCSINYENCEEYRKYSTQVEKRRYGTRK